MLHFIRRNATRIALYLAGGVGALAFAYGVWPTPYRYVSYQTLPVRISRWNGRAEVLTPTGWLAMAPARRAPAQRVLSPAEWEASLSPDNPLRRGAAVVDTTKKDSMPDLSPPAYRKATGRP